MSLGGEISDYIVVGAGSAGAVVVARMTEDPSIRVALVEAGGEDRNPWIHIPWAMGKLFQAQGVNWMYSGVPEPGLSDRVIYHPRGKLRRCSKADTGSSAGYEDRRHPAAPGKRWIHSYPFR